MVDPDQEPIGGGGGREGRGTLKKTLLFRGFLSAKIARHFKEFYYNPIKRRTIFVKSLTRIHWVSGTIRVEDDIRLYTGLKDPRKKKFFKV